MRNYARFGIAALLLAAVVIGPGLSARAEVAAGQRGAVVDLDGAGVRCRGDRWVHRNLRVPARSNPSRELVVDYWRQYEIRRRGLCRDDRRSTRGIRMRDRGSLGGFHWPGPTTWDGQAITDAVSLWVDAAGVVRGRWQEGMVGTGRVYDPGSRRMVQALASFNARPARDDPHNGGQYWRFGPGLAGVEAALAWVAQLRDDRQRMVTLEGADSMAPRGRRETWLASLAVEVDGEPVELGFVPTRHVYRVEARRGAAVAVTAATPLDPAARIGLPDGRVKGRVDMTLPVRVRLGGEQTTYRVLVAAPE